MRPGFIPRLLRCAPILLAAGCGFDSTALTARACSSDVECLTGTCVAGFCQSVGGAADSGVPGDVVPDSVDGSDALDTLDAHDAGESVDSRDGTGSPDDTDVCSAQPRCDGLRVVTCAGGVDTVVEDCGGEGACETEGDCGCSAGQCVPRVCTPGTIVCGADRSTREQCNAGGSELVEIAPCAAGELCVAGVCEASDPLCSRTSQICLDDFTLGICSDDGSEITESTCASGTWCDPVTSDCAPQICTPGTTRCESASRLEECDERGSIWGSPVACPTGTSCTGGVCTARVCPPTLSYCTETGDAATCDLLGTSESIEDCVFRCVDGACQESVCGDAIVDSARSESCDDADGVECDECAACSTRFDLGLGAGVSTGAGPAWVVREQVFTVEFWLRPSGATGQITGLGASNRRDAVSVELADRFVVFRFRSDQDQGIAVRSNVQLPLDTWSHVAVSRTGLASGTLYVNGELAGALAGELDTRSIDDTDGTIWFGSESRVTPVAARIDEYRLSNNVRYGARFNPPRSMSSDGNTIALYRFDEGVGATLRDAVTGSTTVLTGGAFTASSCLGVSPEAYDCGDGVLAPWEQCDDGDGATGDGCSPECRIESRCAAGFEIAGATQGGCYFILAQTSDWETARRTCRSLGLRADLATINDAAENTALAGRGVLPFWIGFNDRDDAIGNGPFVWSAGSSSYTNWAPREPNDGGVGFREDCVEVRGDGLWNDLRCSDQKFAICEFPF